jgi:Bbp16
MSIMDAQLLFCESQSHAAAAASATVSTNVVDLGAHFDHTGAALTDPAFLNGSMCLNVVVEDEDLAAGADSAAVTMELYADSDDTPTTGGDVILSKVLSVTQATNYPDGTQLWCARLPVSALKRYLGFKTSVATQALSTGKITAWIGPPIQQG